jgi:hypothetical protein
VRPRLITSSTGFRNAAVHECRGAGWFVGDAAGRSVTVVGPALETLLTVGLPDGARWVTGCADPDGIYLGTAAGLVAVDRTGAVRWRRDGAVRGCHRDTAGRLWAFEPDTGRVSVYDAGTGRPLTAMTGFGPDGSAEFHVHPGYPWLGVVTAGAGAWGGNWWVALGPTGPTVRRLDRDRLIGPTGDGRRYVTWHRYRLEVVDAATGRALAERDVSGDHPPYLLVDGRGVLLTDALLLIAGCRTPPGEPSTPAEHVVLSTKTLRRLATVDYGFPTDEARLAGSAGPGTWLTIDRGGTASVWSLGWPLEPIPGQLTLL